MVRSSSVYVPAPTLIVTFDASEAELIAADNVANGDPDDPLLLSDPESST